MQRVRKTESRFLKMYKLHVSQQLTFCSIAKAPNKTVKTKLRCISINGSSRGLVFSVLFIENTLYTVYTTG